MRAHPTAIVSEKAEIDDTAEIGPFAIVEDGVKIAGGVKVYAHAYICGGTSIGEGTEVHMGAVLGHAPQDIAFKGGETYLKIGKKNIIREHVTIHRGTKESTATVIGDGNFLMAHCHVGHNCKVGNKIIIVNGALLAGYVDVEDGVFISGNVLVHQFCRIGRLAMIGGFSALGRDAPPYSLVRGVSCVRALNLIGLRRAGIKRDVIKEIKEAFKLLYTSGLGTKEAVAKILERNPGEEARHMALFVKNSKRGICRYKALERYDKAGDGEKNEKDEEGEVDDKV